MDGSQARPRARRLLVAGVPDVVVKILSVLGWKYYILVVLIIFNHVSYYLDARPGPVVPGRGG